MDQVQVGLCWAAQGGLKVALGAKKKHCRWQMAWYKKCHWVKRDKPPLYSRFCLQPHFPVNPTKSSHHSPGPVVPLSLQIARLGPMKSKLFFPSPLPRISSLPVYCSLAIAGRGGFHSSKSRSYTLCECGQFDLARPKEESLYLNPILPHNKETFFKCIDIEL